MLRWLVLVAGAAAVLGVSGVAAASGPTVAEIQAAIVAHSNDLIIANAYSSSGHRPGHGWIDLETGAGRWVSPNGKAVTAQTVTPERHHPGLAIVSETTINYNTRTWYRTSHEASAKLDHPIVVDPLAASPKQFQLIGVEVVDGRNAYHLRSTYFYPENMRLDVWFSTDQAYLIRIVRTGKDGSVVSRIDNHWPSRTPANLALTKVTIPSAFKRLSAPS
jgi:hypothetical protein